MRFRGRVAGAFVVPTCFALVQVSCENWDSLTKCPSGHCDAGTDPGACPGNLLSNPGFDQQASAWSPLSGAAVISVDPGTGLLGGSAGKVCTDGVTFDRYGLEQDGITVPKSGDMYKLSGWLHTAAPQTQTMRAYLIEGTTLGGNVFLDVGLDWKLIEVEYTLTQDTQQVIPAVFEAVYDPPAGSCFLLDDACLIRLGP